MPSASRTVSLEPLQLLGSTYLTEALHREGIDIGRLLASPARNDTLDVLARFDNDIPRLVVTMTDRALANSIGAHIDVFLRTGLGLAPTSDTREALWRELRRTKGMARYGHIPPKSVLPYLRVSVDREATRITRDRERADRLWWHSGSDPQELGDKADCDMLSPVYGDMPHDQADSASDPYAIIVRKEDVRARLDVVQDMRRDGLPTDQERLLDLLASGVLPARAVEMIGKGWSPYQALQRKAKRRLASQRRLAHAQ